MRPSYYRIYCHRRMAASFDPRVQKSAATPSPFRRIPFEPMEPYHTRPVVAKFLVPRMPNEAPPPVEPAIGPNGEELYTLRDVQIHIAREVRKAEQQVHRDAVLELTEHLAQFWKTANSDKRDKDAPPPSYFS